MGRCICWDLLNGNVKLRDSAVEVAGVEQAASGVGGEGGGLERVGAFGDLGSEFALGGGAFGVALLPEDGGQGGVSSGEFRLQADGFSQRSGSVGEIALLF